MTPEQKELAVIEVLLQFIKVQTVENPKFKDACAVTIEEVETYVDLPHDDILKVIKRMTLFGIIDNPPWNPHQELFVCYTQRLIDRRAELLADTGGNQPEAVHQADTFTISVKDREIRINRYVISKPHSIGSNFEFLDYIRSQPVNTLIQRDDLPHEGNLSLGQQIRKKGFIKILNGLGFKGEILKAFFYDRSKDTLTYRGDQVTIEGLEYVGVDISLFLKELELIHMKHSVQSSPM